MIKKIKVEQLETGMYIHDLDCGWMQHPFLSNSLKVKNDKIVEKIVNYGIRDLYIDTEKGLDVEDARTVDEVNREIQSEINKIADRQPPSEIRVPIEKEIVKAKEIRKEAKRTVHDLMDEVRFGKKINTENVENVVDKMVDSIFRNEDALISLGRIKHTDEYTYMHSMSVCVLMISFGKQLGFDAKQLREAGIGAMLHDIGKMKVPQEILNCTGGLNDQQYEIMKKHVEYARDLLDETAGISELSKTLACQHHERIDGRGYPKGLKGDEISMYGQIAAIADVYDAMTSQRCYQRKYEPTEVLRKLYEWDSFYNKDLVEKFVRCIGIYPVGTLVRLESGLLGVVLDHGSNNLLRPHVRIIYDAKRSKYISTSYDLDLAEKGSEKVDNYEVPEKWGIKPELYL